MSEFHYTGGNTLLTWLHGDDLGPWMIALHAAFGVGSALVPLVLAVSRRSTDGINGGLFVIVAMVVVASVVVLRRPSPVHLRSERLATSVAKPTPWRVALVITAGFFFMYVGLEIGFAGWVFTFARDRGFSETRASLLTSVFWWSFTAGRVLGIPVARRLSARVWILVDAGVTVVGAVLLVLSAQSDLLVWMGTIVLGLGLATMFPAMLNLADERVAVTGSGHIVVHRWFGRRLCDAAVGDRSTLRRPRVEDPAVVRVCGNRLRRCRGHVRGSYPGAQHELTGRSCPCLPARRSQRRVHEVDDA